MELYIQIRNGQPFEHPILGENLRQFFPELDPNNPPEGFARFVRVAHPQVGMYQVYEGVSYELVDGVYTDVHHIRDMTQQEKDEKISIEMTMPHSDQAVFDESICGWIEPIPVQPNIDASGSAPSVVY